MKSILIVSPPIEDIRNIDKAFPSDFRIDKASDYRQAMQILKKEDTIRICGKGPYPNYFFCAVCHHRIGVYEEGWSIF